MSNVNSDEPIRRLASYAVLITAVSAFAFGTASVLLGAVELYRYGLAVGAVWICGAAYFRALDPNRDTRAARHAASYFAAIGVAILAASTGVRVPGELGYQLQTGAIGLLGALALRRWWRVAVVELGEYPFIAKALPVRVAPPEATRGADPSDVTVPIEADTQHRSIMNFENLLERLKAYRPAKTESESERDGAFSTFAEVNAGVAGLGLGLAAGLAAAPGTLLPVILGLAGYRGGQNEARTGRLREAAKEPGHAIGAAVVGYGVAALTNPAAVEAVRDLLDSGIIYRILGM